MVPLSQRTVIVTALFLFLGIQLVGGASSNAVIKRLGDNVIPTRYRLDVMTYLENNFTFLGEVWIDIDVKEPTNEILLHSQNLQIMSAKLERISKVKDDMKIYFIDKRIVSNTLSLNHPNTTKIVFPGRQRIDTEETTPVSEEPKDINYGAGENKTNNEDIDDILSELFLDVFQQNTTEIAATAEKEIDSGAPLNVPQESDLPEDTLTSNNDATNTNSPNTDDSAILSQIYNVFEPPTVATSTLTLVKPRPRYFARVSATFSVGPLPIKHTDIGTPVVQTTTEQKSNRTKTENATTQRVSVTKNPPSPTNSSTNKDHVAKTITVSDIILDASNDMVQLKLSGKLEEKTKYRLHLKYAGKLSDDNTGYYRVPYRERGTNETKWLASTVFEAMEARRAFPCFDEPKFKAVFQVNLARRLGIRTLSNMELSSTRAMANNPGWEIDSYKESPRMSTYLVAFYVGQLKSRETKTVNGKLFRIWTRQTTRNELTDYALESGPKFEQYYENYFDVKNPLNKTDLLALPVFISDALENWGLISFEEKYIFHQAGVSTESTKQTVATVLAHELAHTWFGNLVTMDWWSNIWLNEGFATYFAAAAVDFVHPEWDFQSVHAVKAFLRVFSIDALRSSHPLIPTVDNKDVIDNLFDTITYYKGYYLLRMVRHTLGEATFRKGISSYLKASVFGTVGQDDIWRHLTRQAHADGTLAPDQDLVEIMTTWTKVPGYPTVSVLRDYEYGTIDIIQNRFLRPQGDLESRTEPEEDNSWWIPLTYTSEKEMLFNETTPRFWLDPDELVATIDEDVPPKRQWMIFNIQAAGMYRVNYDMQNWAMLSRYLDSPEYHRIDKLNRAQLLDDVLDFARTGDVPYPVALGLASYMKRETHYIPWLATISNMDYIQRMLRSTNATDRFQNFVRDLVTPVFTTLGFRPKADEQALDTLNRQQIVFWACRTGVPTCVQPAISQFRDWMAMSLAENTTNPIASNLRLAVYCTALEYGGEEEWGFLFLKYLVTSIPSERSSILEALGCTRKVHILKKYLELSIAPNSALRKQDSLAVFKAVAKNEVGLDLATTFFKDNFKMIKNIRQLPKYLDVLASLMHTEEQLQKMEEIQGEGLETFRSNSQPIQLVNEKLRFNVDWAKRNLDSISHWLEERQESRN